MPLRLFLLLLLPSSSLTQKVIICCDFFWGIKLTLQMILFVHIPHEAFLLEAINGQLCTQGGHLITQNRPIIDGTNNYIKVLAWSLCLDDALGVFLSKKWSCKNCFPDGISVNTAWDMQWIVPKRPMILTTRPILCLRPKLGGSNRWNVSLLTDFDMLCKTHMKSQFWKTPLRQLNTISPCTKLHPVLLRSTSKPMELVWGPKSLSQIPISLSSMWWKIYWNFYYLNYLYFNKFS